jgi:hypothetical protein
MKLNFKILSIVAVASLIGNGVLAYQWYHSHKGASVAVYDFNTPEFYHTTEVLPCPEDDTSVDVSLPLEDIIRGDISCTDGKCRPTYTYKEIDSGDVSLHWHNIYGDAHRKGRSVNRICRRWGLPEGQRMVHLWSDLNGGGGVDYILILDADLNVTDRIINSY